MNPELGCSGPSAPSKGPWPHLRSLNHQHPKSHTRRPLYAPSFSPQLTYYSAGLSPTLHYPEPLQRVAAAHYVVLQWTAAATAARRCRPTRGCGRATCRGKHVTASQYHERFVNAVSSRSRMLSRPICSVLRLPLIAPRRLQGCRSSAPSCDLLSVRFCNILHMFCQSRTTVQCLRCVGQGVGQFALRLSMSSCARTW